MSSVLLTFCFFARREDFEQKQTKGRDPSDFDGIAKVVSQLILCSLLSKIWLRLKAALGNPWFSHSRLAATEWSRTRRFGLRQFFHEAKRPGRGVIEVGDEAVEDE